MVTARIRPLVAVTAVGIGGGGFGGIRGTVVDLLLDVCQDAVETSGIDVVIVAKDASIYSALQARRRARIETAGGDILRLGAAKALAKRARNGDLVLFLGAGLSMGAGLPSWTGLLEELGRRTASASTGSTRIWTRPSCSASMAGGRTASRRSTA